MRQRLALSLALVLAGGTGLAAELEVGIGQRAPRAAKEGDCRLPDAKPLLEAKDYLSSGYELKTASQKPLVLEESAGVKTAQGPAALKVQQRGCADVYVKFEFAYPEEGGAKGLMGPGPALARAAEGLKALSLAPASLLGRDRLFEIAGALEAKAHSVWQHAPVKGFEGFVACLSHLPKECATDVAVKFDFPRLKVIYIDRP